MFTAAIFTIARTWEQPKHLSTEECIKKMWYIYTMGYYSDIERNETVSCADMWMALETVIQSIMSEKEKQISYINIYMWNLENLQSRNRDTDI